MLDFKPLDKNSIILKEDFNRQSCPFCEFSVGEKYLWRDAFKVDYAEFMGEHILKESSPTYGYTDAFYYPKNPAALPEIEKWCAQSKTPLSFCYLTHKDVEAFKTLYPCIDVTFDRDTSDYIYNIEDFKGYRGKKFSGQRNHVNKFIKTYPEARYKRLEKEDIPSVIEFLHRYENQTTFDAYLKKEELVKLQDFIENIDLLGVDGGVIYLGGEIIALTLGEVVGDTLVVHVEKALKDYSGVYPTIASRFACNTPAGIKYINREEDCGEDGLRMSKMQYHPIEIKHKYFVKVHSTYNLLDEHIELSSDRLIIDEIRPMDQDTYCSLYLDPVVNKYYGYDYHEDMGDKAPTSQYFYDFQQSLKDKKEEYSLAVRDRNTKDMIGELVVYNFGYDRTVEIGFRFFHSVWGNGYALEAAAVLIDYLKKIGFETIKARAYKENIKSQKLLNRLGFSLSDESSTHYFFSFQK